MTPAETLRAAATRLREKAAQSTPGPWEIEYGYRDKTPQAVFVMNPDNPDNADSSIEIGGMDRPDDNVWIALLGPDKAEPLANWLDVTARMADIGCRMAGRISLSVEQKAALAFARSILGEES